jgi:hypothetical protein
VFVVIRYWSRPCEQTSHVQSSSRIFTYWTSLSWGRLVNILAVKLSHVLPATSELIHSSNDLNCCWRSCGRSRGVTSRAGAWTQGAASRSEILYRSVLFDCRRLVPGLQTGVWDMAVCWLSGVIAGWYAAVCLAGTSLILQLLWLLEEYLQHNMWCSHNAQRLHFIMVLQLTSAGSTDILHVAMMEPVQDGIKDWAWPRTVFRCKTCNCDNQ